MTRQLIYRNSLLLGLFLLSVFCMGLLGFRIFIADSMRYIFLSWNLFLAAMPYFFIGIAQISSQRGSKLFSVLSMALCILFLPNSPYIITDLFHITQRTTMPLWYDTLLVFSFALCGLLFFYATLGKMESILPSPFRYVFIITVIFLCAFGIYLGRYLRFNSWDILSNYDLLLSEMYTRFRNPLQHPRTWGFTLGYGSLLAMGAVCIKLFQQYLYSIRPIEKMQKH